VKTSLFILGSLAFLQPLVTQAGGPWLVYQWGSKTEGGLSFVNLGYDSGPQFTASEADDDEDTSLRFKLNPSTKKTEVWLLTYDGDDDNPGIQKNQWHRTSWGREGKNFILLNSQYEVVGVSGVSDHGVGFMSGKCVSWPNKGKSIGISGDYPLALIGEFRRIDGNWVGTPLGSGRRQVKSYSGKMTLDIALTKALNDARAGIATTLDAKNWAIAYLVSNRGFEQVPNEDQP